MYKKNKKLYDAVMKSVEEIIKNPHHYKPLKYDLKGLSHVHLEKSFVLIFEIDYPWLSAEEITKEVDKILKDYYLSPRYIPLALRQVFRKHSFNEMRGFCIP